MMFFSVDHNVNIALKDDDYKVIFRPSGRGIPDMIASLYFTGEYVAVDVSGSLYGVLSEKYGGFYGLFVHLFSF